jgi:LEA14-like dessication related protein
LHFIYLYYTLKIAKKRPIIIEAMRRPGPFQLFYLPLLLLAVLSLSACKTRPARPSEAGTALPEFSITEIAILKAELINTRFRVKMEINNPNPFPIELSAFRYRLYGNDLLWAEGTERNLFVVPAESSIEARLFLLMNFIDMNRNILDQVIHLVDVNYRFAGEVQVRAGHLELPGFHTAFDLSGYSKVLEEH